MTTTAKPWDPLTGPWLVRVIDRETRKPVPGATIISDAYRYHELSEEQQQEHDANQMQGLPGSETNLLRFGKRSECDARGEALVPRVPAGCRLWVLTKHYGNRFVRDTEPAPVLFEVDRDFALRVQAVDGAGKPVPNVSFALRVQDGEHDFCASAEFRPTGDPTIQIMRRFPTKLRELLGALGNSPVKISLEAQGLPTARALFVPDPHADQLVRVPVALSGGVRILFGERALLPGTTVLVREPNGEDVLTVRPRRGIAELTRIGLGLSLQLQTTGADGSRLTRDFAGPTVPGEVRVVDLR